MKRLLKRLPMLLFLLFMWLVLYTASSIGQIVFGTLLSMALIWAASSLRPLHGSPKRPAVMVKLIVNVITDIIRSNLAVGRIIWLGRRAHAKPGFLKIPLDIRDPHGLAALACIITYTPGTVWAAFSEETHILTLHVLDLQDEAQWICTIKQRYERALMEIFQ